jgi:hypothetical protein
VRWPVRARTHGSAASAASEWCRDFGRRDRSRAQTARRSGMRVRHRRPAGARSPTTRPRTRTSTSGRETPLGQERAVSGAVGLADGTVHRIIIGFG